MDWQNKLGLFWCEIADVAGGGSDRFALKRFNRSVSLIVCDFVIIMLWVYKSLQAGNLTCPNRKSALWP